MKNESLPEIDLENHTLIFKTHNNTFLGWNILSDLASEDIDDQLKAAATEWLSGEDGMKLVQEEKLDIWGMDYARVLMNIPPELLARYRIYPGTALCEIIELGWEESPPPEIQEPSEPIELEVKGN